MHGRVRQGRGAFSARLIPFSRNRLFADLDLPTCAADVAGGALLLHVQHAELTADLLGVLLLVADLRGRLDLADGVALDRDALGGAIGPHRSAPRVAAADDEEAIAGT